MVNKAMSTFLFTFQLVFRQLRTYSSKYLPRKPSSVSLSSRFHKYISLHGSGLELPEKTAMICNIEGGLLRSSNLFPYFMLVAFEAGSILRALVLLVLYPLLCLVGREEVRLKIMVMVCFFGIREDGFRIGTSVLPKFLLEDVGLEGFEVMNKKNVVKKVGVSNMPRVMIESFLKDYMAFDSVVGRELKVVRGYFVGLMEGQKNQSQLADFIVDEADINMMIGICSGQSSLDNQLVSLCDEMYLTTESARSNWSPLPTEKYSKPLVFHDGRLAFRPTPLATLGMFMWLPFGFLLFIIRCIVGFFLPYTISKPFLAFSGIILRLRFDAQETPVSKSRGVLYVCNHRTLLDPLYLCFILKKNLTAVTYSLSKVSETFSPIKTVRLTRDFCKDSKIMEQMLTQGDSVVCPEGTTCREPYLLRFSPLFTEMSEVIIPVALDSEVNMFYGTTASGFKCLDPLFFLMNPFPFYTVKFLDPIRGLSSSSHSLSATGRDSRRFDIANQVQSELAKSLNFACTNLTRKDKYLTLAGNSGLVSTSNQSESENRSSN